MLTNVFRSVRIRNKVTGAEATTDAATWDKYVATGKKDPQWDEIPNSRATASTDQTPTNQPKP